jgi:CubicO group peptidase (beta-lactamase class C family)
MDAEGRIRHAAMKLGRLVDQRKLGGVEGVSVFVEGLPSVEHHWTPDVRRDVFSVSKTFVSVAVGLAEAEGMLRLNDPLLRHLDHLAPTAATGTRSITIQQVLTMTSGIVYRWDDSAIGAGVDPAQTILAAPLGFEPGTGFAYRGGSTYLLSRVIHSCSGQDVRDFLQTRLFTPLSIKNPPWQRCTLGFSLGAVGLSLRTEEVARLGQTLLDEGPWRGRQVVPADYVLGLISDSIDTDGHQATNAAGPHPENARYGRHVWLCARDDAWRMDGMYGQFCVMLPQQKACVTVTGHYRGPTTDILDAIWSEIVPALR